MDNPYKPLMEALEKVYGKASDAGFGSAVFHEPASNGSPLEELALMHYKRFLGTKWADRGEATWKKTWKRVYSRPADTKGDILQELASITDAGARSSIPLLTELIEQADAAREALAAACNHPDVRQLGVYTIGDGEAMSGVLVTHVYDKNYTCTVIALMD